MNALNTTRASAKCYALARQRLVSHGQYNNYRRSRCCFSSLQHDTHQLMAPTIDRDDDDEQHNKMHSRAIYQYPLPTIHPSHPSLLYNTSCTIIGTTINNNNNYNNSNFTTTTTIRQQQQQQYYYSTTPSKERGAAIVMTLGAIAATAKAGQYAVQGYNEWKEGRDLEMKEQEKLRKEENGDAENAHDAGGGASKNNTDGASDSSTSTNNTQSSGTNEKRENIFAKFFDLSVGSKYYEGGFEDKMTRKEAALILGVRESSAPKRIKEAHRKLLILNHPDTGGSTFIAGKINEAKELLLKGKK